MNTIIKPLGRELRGSKRSWGILLGIITGFYLFGMAFTAILMTTVVDDNSYAPLSMLFAQIGAAIALFAMMDRFNGGFDTAVKMGETRRSYLWAAFFTTALELAVMIGFLWLLRLIETGFQNLFFPGVTVEVDTTVWLQDVKLVLGIVIFVIGLLSLFGALLHRYGRKAFWGMWVLWMFAFIVGPRIMDAVEEGNDSVFGHIGRWLAEVFSSGFGIDVFYILLGGGVIGVAASVLLLRRASVSAT